MCVTTDCGKCGGPLVRFGVAVSAGVWLASSGTLGAVLAAVSVSLWLVVAVLFGAVVPAAVVAAVAVVRYYSRPVPARRRVAAPVAAPVRRALPAPPRAIEAARPAVVPAERVAEIMRRQG